MDFMHDDSWKHVYCAAFTEEKITSFVQFAWPPGCVCASLCNTHFCMCTFLMGLSLKKTKRSYNSEKIVTIVKMVKKKKKFR